MMTGTSGSSRLISGSASIPLMRGMLRSIRITLGCSLLQLLQRRRAVRRGDDLEPLGLQDRVEEGADLGLVVHHQDLGQPIILM